MQMGLGHHISVWSTLEQSGEQEEIVIHPVWEMGLNAHARMLARARTRQSSFQSGL